MAEDQVEEVKARIDIVSLISEYLELKKAGRNYKGLCPFHSEKTSSFMVSPELQIYKCFGCGEGGDVISFLQKHEGMDFPEALNFLAEKVGVKLKKTRPDLKSKKETIYQVNSLASYFYHYLLLNHRSGKVALDYLTKRRGLEVETIKKFQLGYCPNVNLALKRYLIDKKKFKLEDLALAGVVYMKGGRAYDRFRGRIIFPLHDQRGNTVGFAARILESSKGDLAKYINTPETQVYHKSNLLYALNITRQEIKRKDEAVVVEGELDAISSWQAGIRNAVAIKGSSLTQEQSRLLSRFTKTVVLALDADFAGDKAARKAIETAENFGLEVKVAKLVNYKDPDEMARDNPQAFKKALENAVGVYDYIIDSIFSSHDARSATGKARISKEVIPVLSEISDSIVQAHYVSYVSQRLKVSEEAVFSEIEKFLSRRESRGPEVFLVKAEAKTRRELLEERILAMAFQHDHEILFDKDLEELMTTPLARRILEEFFNFYKKEKGFGLSKFSQSLPEELVDGFTTLALTERQGFKEDVNSIQKEFDLSKKELGVMNVKAQLAQLVELIRNLEQKGEKENLVKAQRKFGSLSNKLHELESKYDKGIIL